MEEKLIKIINEIKSLTLLDLLELINKIEKIFNLNLVEIAEDKNIHNEIVHVIETKSLAEKNLFSLTLLEYPQDKKISILKIIRSVTGLGIKEAKDLIENLPKLIKDNVQKNDLELIKKEFELIGAKIKLE